MSCSPAALSSIVSEPRKDSSQTPILRRNMFQLEQDVTEKRWKQSIRKRLDTDMAFSTTHCLRCGEITLQKSQVP